MDEYNNCILSFAKIKILYKITLSKFMYVVKNVDVNFSYITTMISFRCQGLK